MSTSEELNASLNLLKLIILNDRNVKSKLDETYKTSPDNILDDDMTFRFYRKERGEGCDCWFTNEYFEYVNSDTVDLAMFETVTNNIRKGHCPHFDPDSRKNSKLTGISLVHAAAAMGNKSVVKYLLAINKRVKFRKTYSASLPPMFISALKNRTAIIKYLHVEALNFDYIHSESIGRVKRALLKHRYKHYMYLNISSMEVAFRNKENNRVTVNNVWWPHGSFINPCAQIFYARVALTAATLDIIQNYMNADEIQMILQHAIYRLERQEATKLVSRFSNCVAQFNIDLVLECVLWDNLEPLNMVLKKVNAENLHYSGYSLVDIAEFLNHMQCVRVLQNYSKPKPVSSSKQQFVLGDGKKEQDRYSETKGQKESPFSIILDLSLERGYDIQSTCKLLLKVCTKRYDVNLRNKNGMTPVHLCLESGRRTKCLTAVLQTLFDQGADPNIQDVNGRSALYLTLTPYNSPLGLGPNTYHVIRTMKTVLYYNAVPTSTKTAVHYAISRDRMNSFLRYIHDPTATVILINNEANSTRTVIAETNRDKFLAFSFVAILVELGFALEKSVFTQLTELPPELCQYINETLSSPRSLQSRCRNVIRNAYPGPQLQKFLRDVRTPDAISDIILFKPYLLRTQIRLASGKIIFN